MICYNATKRSIDAMRSTRSSLNPSRPQKIPKCVANIGRVAGIVPRLRGLKVAIFAQALNAAEFQRLRPG